MRDAFRSFLGVSRSVEIVLWGSRQNAYEKFKEALIDEPEREHLLLVDSETPFKENQTPWLHVKNREGDGWNKPQGATDDQLQFMAQCVEAWLVADEEKLKEFYGAKLGNLHKTQNVEEIPKTGLMAKLNQATKRTEKGEYHKVRHFPTLFKMIRRNIVRERAPNCKRLLDFLQSTNFLEN